MKNSWPSRRANPPCSSGRDRIKLNFSSLIPLLKSFLPPSDSINDERELFSFNIQHHLVLTDILTSHRDPSFGRFHLDRLVPAEGLGFRSVVDYRHGPADSFAEYLQLELVDAVEIEARRA